MTTKKLMILGTVVGAISFVGYCVVNLLGKPSHTVKGTKGDHLRKLVKQNTPSRKDIRAAEKFLVKNVGTTVVGVKHFLDVKEEKIVAAADTAVKHAAKVKKETPVVSRELKNKIDKAAKDTIADADRVKVEASKVKKAAKVSTKTAKKNVDVAADNTTKVVKAASKRVQKNTDK